MYYRPWKICRVDQCVSKTNRIDGYCYICSARLDLDPHKLGEYSEEVYQEVLQEKKDHADTLGSKAYPIQPEGKTLHRI